jgi:phosphoglycolate phosphatase-like HAD superfamily hydrolase
MSDYATYIFDCDGVILDSNGVKTEAFRKAALPWGHDAAAALVSYHVANGGISRQIKFTHFLQAILPQYAPGTKPGIDGPGLEELLVSYAKAVRGGLMTCAIAEGLEALRSQTAVASWSIVSGGDQTELREIFAARGIDQLFDAGIYGGPENKDMIFEREIKGKNIRLPAIFMGDSCYDCEAAKRAGLDFVFVSDWTDLRGWESFVAKNHLQTICKLRDLLVNHD